MIDLTGKTFGELTVLERGIAPGKKTNAWWTCRCSCGSVITVDGNKLRSGKTKSCGCKRGEHISASKQSHGDSRRKNVSTLYKKWAAMKRRCLNPNEQNYSRYGGRGITVCKEWVESYETFRAWALTAGYQEGLSIDRIDPDGPYCPDNCRWISIADQASNTRKNIYATMNGETKTVKEWSRIFAVKYETLRYRLRKGMSLEEAVKGDN